MRTFKLFSLLAIANLSLVAQVRAQYQITDLGTQSSGIFSPRGINSSGQVTGWSSQGMVMWSAGVFHVIGPLGGGASYGINDLGQVAGMNLQHAVVGDMNNGVTDLGTLDGVGSSSAYDVNNAGWVVGSSQNSSFAERAFIWRAGKGMTDLGVLPGIGGSQAWAINQAGWVAGESGSAVIWDPTGQIIDIDAPGNFSWAHDISDNNEVVGAYLVEGAYQAFRWTPGGGSQNLGTLGGDDSRAEAVNNNGLIVGNSTNAQDQGRPFLYQAGLMHDLNSMIAAGSGWTLTQAWDINDAGQIVGNGMFNGESHGFLLTPIPGPGGLAVIAISAAFASRRRRRCSKVQCCFKNSSVRCQASSAAAALYSGRSASKNQCCVPRYS